jgi:hypothetical protein
MEIILLACLGLASVAMSAVIILKSRYKVLGGVLMGISISHGTTAMITGGTSIVALIATCVITALGLIYVLMLE